MFIYTYLYIFKHNYVCNVFFSLSTKLGLRSRQPNIVDKSVHAKKRATVHKNHQDDILIFSRMQKA